MSIRYLKIVAIIILLASFLFGCAGSKQGDVYLERQPHLRLEKFFDGDVRAWGIIQDRQGTVITRFTAEIEASWNGNQGVLDELFTYHDSGKTQKRLWKINKLNDFEYIGEANDIIGQASGKQFGNAIYWTYEMNVPFKGSEYRVKFEDWLWSMDEGVVFNRSYIKKFGFKVAEVTIFMQKQKSQIDSSVKETRLRIAR